MSEDAATPGENEEQCSSCEAIVDRSAEMCPNCGVLMSAGSVPGVELTTDKSRFRAAALALFLGGLGTHKFYLGYRLKGVLYLLFVWTLIPVLVGIGEAIVYLTRSEEEFHQQYVNE